MKAAGLLDKTGKLVGEKDFVKNPYDWTLANVKPALKKQGVEMDEEHKGDLVTAVTKMFSNRKVADYIASMLVNEGVIEKDKALLRGAKGTEGADQARREDAFQASTSITTQLKDAAASFLKLQPVIDGMNALATTMSKAISKFDTGTPAEKIGAGAGVAGLGAVAATGGALGLRAAYQWFTGGTAALNASAAALDVAAANLTAAAARIAAGSVAGAAAAGGSAAAAGGGAAAGAGGSALWGAGAAALPYLGGAAALIGAGLILRKSVDDAGYEGTTSGERMKRQRGGLSVRELIHREFGGDGEKRSEGSGGDKTTNVAVTGNVEGEGTITIKIEAGSSLVQAVEQAKTALKLAGQVNSNGPGSTGKSSPDATAPSTRGSTGGASGDW